MSGPILLKSGRREAQGVRKAFLPGVVSTSGRIHGDLLRLLYLLADNKTKRHFRDLNQALDDDSEAYCWRRSGFFWRMRASLGLACAQATTLASQGFGKGNPRSRAGRPSVWASPPQSGSSSPHRTSIYILFCLSLSFCLYALKLRSLHFTHPVYVASRSFQ